MKATNNTSRLNKSEILVNELVFYTYSTISLYGFVRVKNQYIETEYLMDCKQLRILLEQNGSIGAAIDGQLERLFDFPHRVPASINLVELFGTTQELKAERIVMDAILYDSSIAGIPVEKFYEVLMVEEVCAKPSKRA